MDVPLRCRMRITPRQGLKKGRRADGTNAKTVERCHIKIASCTRNNNINIFLIQPREEMIYVFVKRINPAVSLLLSEQKYRIINSYKQYII
jgi:hypothetical protein